MSSPNNFSGEIKKNQQFLVDKSALSGAMHLPHKSKIFAQTYLFYDQTTAKGTVWSLYALSVIEPTHFTHNITQIELFKFSDKICVLRYPKSVIMGKKNIHSYNSKFWNFLFSYYSVLKLIRSVYQNVYRPPNFKFNINIWEQKHRNWNDKRFLMRYGQSEQNIFI